MSFVAQLASVAEAARSNQSLKRYPPNLLKYVDGSFFFMKVAFYIQPPLMTVLGLFFSWQIRNISRKT